MKFDNKKIVIFDWGGIVESHLKGEENCYTARVNIIKRLTAESNKDDENTICAKWEKCDTNGKYISVVDKDEELKEWFERIKLEFNLDCNYDEFCEVYQEEFDKVKYYKDVVEFAHGIKDKCKIGILSNLIKLDKPRIDKHYDLSKFDFVWLSFELNCRKPDEKIYEIVEKDCKIKPQNILFIDDDKNNISTARKRGWKTCNAYGYELDKIKEMVEIFLNK